MQQVTERRRLLAKRAPAHDRAVLGAGQRDVRQPQALGASLALGQLDLGLLVLLGAHVDLQPQRVARVMKLQ